ncbi:MAG: type II secretion system minor pseudopilin GspH [Pseudomonadota bacterium]|nr:type II secretion system minor pseudopilin GspH [Pseudomonadota bacterium]
MLGQPRGFTLIEILIVLFVISVMTGLVVVTLPGFVQSNNLEREAERLKLVLEIAVEEAQVQSRELAIQPARDQYRFYVYDELNQRGYEMNSPPLGLHRLPDDVSLNFSVESKPFTLSLDKSSVLTDDEDSESASKGKSKGKKTPPPILFLSSGETTLFTLTLISVHGASRMLETDGFGSFKWLGQGDESDR